VSRFFAGTYFPKERTSRPSGFLDMLPQIESAYREKGTVIAEQSRHLAEA
jgi:uncharacterized protein YyaL (SSP411 family)